MSISPAPTEPRAQAATSPGVRHAIVLGVIGVLRGAGVPISAEMVYRAMHCRRSTVQASVRAWQAQPPEAADGAPCPVPSTPPAPPAMSHLVSLRGQVAQLDTAWEAMRQAHARLQDERAHAHADYRNGILDASRLTRRLRQAEAQARSPVSLMQPDAAQQRAQMRADLEALVGQAEVKRVLADPHYVPWWMER